MYYRFSGSTRAVAIVLTAVLCGCSAGKSEKKERKLAKIEKKREKAARRQEGLAPQGVDFSRFASTECDESLWTRVYDPTRLERLAACVAVSGTVEESAPDDDGDQHFLLKLDAGQESLINKRNRKKKNGDLVVEIVCANPVTLEKAKAACSGYRNSIGLPAVGSQVTAIGAYVIDSHNGWAEVHPVSRLRITKR